MKVYSNVIKEIYIYTLQFSSKFGNGWEYFLCIPMNVDIKMDELMSKFIAQEIVEDKSHYLIVNLNAHECSFRRMFTKKCLTNGQARWNLSNQIQRHITSSNLSRLLTFSQGFWVYSCSCWIKSMIHSFTEYFLSQLQYKTDIHNKDWRA